MSGPRDLCPDCARGKGKLMGRFMVTIDARYLDDDDNEIDEFSTAADGDTAGEVAGTATAEIGTNLWNWMREKEQA